MRSAIAKASRILATPEVAKHRVFVWLAAGIVPDKNLVAIARADDTTFGILHSRFHELWSLRLGTSLEDRPRYTSSSTFETFPFPPNLTPRDTDPSPALPRTPLPKGEGLGVVNRMGSTASWSTPLPTGEGLGVRAAA